MRTKLFHPLWAHLAAAAAATALVVRLVMVGPLSARAPIHFGAGGLPNGYGSPWLAFALTIGLSLLFIGLSVTADEIWAREEKRKTFNWISLLDDAVVGFLVGTSLGYLDYLVSGAATFSFPWTFIAATMGGAVLLSVVLEFLRPFRPHPRQVQSFDTGSLEQELRQRLNDNETFVYWQSQNPGWVSLVSILIPLLLIAAAVYSWFSIPWVSIELLVIGMAMILFNGGMRVTVTRESITIRFGLGFKVKQVPLAQVSSVDLHEFSGLRDFGGFGIRFNGQMTGYFLRGSKGVKVTTTNGKQYLIGSDHPESLYSAIRFLIGAASAT